MAVGAVCAVAGATMGIAGAGAHHGTFPPGRAMHFAGPAVHADLVVPNRQGGFDTVTMDRGTVSSVSGGQLTINEGTPKATYKTLTLTIPSDAIVSRNGQSAQLTDLQAGDFAAVVQTQGRTFVKAFDPNARPGARFSRRSR